ncbi:MAG: OsmC family protein [bacterium]|nr:OsmC family protein [bacterium]
MSKLDPFLKRKTESLLARQAEWTVAPEKGVILIRGSSHVAGITGARPTRMGDHAIVSDSTPGLAGHALGPTAPEMLMGAIGSCLVHTYLIQAAILGIGLDDVQVEVTGTLDMRGVIGMEVEQPPRIENITYTAHIESDADDAAIVRLHEAVEKWCPVLLTLRAGTGVTRVS